MAKEVIDLVSDCCIGEAYRAMPMTPCPACIKWTNVAHGILGLKA